MKLIKYEYGINNFSSVSYGVVMRISNSPYHLLWQSEFRKCRLQYCGNYIINFVVIDSLRPTCKVQATNGNVNYRPSWILYKIDIHINKMTHTSFNVIFSC